MPAIILYVLDKKLGIDIFSYLPQSHLIRLIVALPLLALLAMILVLPAYRSKIAADAYGEGSMGFWEAHRVSKVMLNSTLSFLPVIGFFFLPKNER